MVSPDGEIVAIDPDDVEVDTMIKQHQRQLGKRTGGGSSSRGWSAGDNGMGTKSGNRGRLGDVTREFGGMDVSDDEHI